MISQKVLTNGSTLSFPRLPRLHRLLDEAFKLNEALEPFEGSRISSVSARVVAVTPPENYHGYPKDDSLEKVTPFKHGNFVGIYVSFLGCIPIRFLVAVWERCTFCSSTQCHHHIQVWPEIRGKTLLVTSKNQNLWTSKNELCTQKFNIEYISYLKIFWRATSHCLTWLKARIINPSHELYDKYTTVAFCISMMLRRLASLSSC